MAGSVVQERARVENSGSTTLSDTITGVAAGNHIVAHVGADNGGGAGFTATVSDGTSYSVGDVKREDLANNQMGYVYYLENAGAGSHTVTVTVAGGTPGNIQLKLYEVSGLRTSGSLDASTGQHQATPGTGTDGVSSGATSATTNAQDFVMAFTQNTSEASPGTSAITAGTGFTKVGTENYMACAYKSVAATGAQTGTFTQSVAAARVSHVVVFKEISGPTNDGEKSPVTFLSMNSVGRFR